MKTIFTYLTLLLLSISSFAEVSPVEKNALLKLYKATKGSQWITKWDLKSPVSTWYGVGVKEDKVVSLKLINNNLVGQLPTELGDLASLEVLNLFRNSISGSLPITLGNLKNLTQLNIAFNQVSGALPEELGNATHLKSIELHMNRLTGELPVGIGNLASLEVLSLFNNEIEGTIPVSYTHLRAHETG
jgi:Leucine-rich repeat (LRR) protein